MARRQVISTGKDIASAVIRGLNELGRRRDQVDVTVLQKPTKGFLGIGAKKARVQIVEKAWDSEHSTPMRTGIRKRSAMNYNSNKKSRRTRRPRHLVEKTVTMREPKANEAQKLPSAEIQNAIIPDNIKQPMQDAKNALNEMLGKMGVKVNNLNTWWDAKQERILLTFDCDYPALVIGKEAKTLQSIQYLITLMVSRNFNEPISVVADTQNYWNKLEEKINKDIAYALMTIRRNKRPYRFRPMSAQMRRYIHHYLAEEQDIVTVSEGEGKWRKVVIKIAKPEDKIAQTAPTETQPVAETQPIAEIQPVAEVAETPKTEEQVQDSCVLTAESTSCSQDNANNAAVNNANVTEENTPAETASEIKPAENQATSPEEIK
ncbi:MAG: Jag N-terminal domain-containing protein [Elusimicrobiaceae bacterium]|nr:Jag N-terminal domain-containing protein [Elusimicrobiaceae bacterium]